jgi:hypothetical protein
LAGFLISSSWEENYGESKTNMTGSVFRSMLEGLVVLKSGKYESHAAIGIGGEREVEGRWFMQLTMIFGSFF